MRRPRRSPKSRSSRTLGGERFESRRLMAVVPVSGAARDDADESALSGGCPVCGGGCCSHTDDGGLVYMACAFPAPAAPALRADTVATAVAPLEDTFKLHSRSSATKKIYLDFDGHVTSGTAWRNGQSFTTPAFSLDSNFNAFSDDERRAIQEIWSRVAEDFVIFDVDVTTEAPTVEDLRNTGGSDDRWGIRVVVGGEGEWLSGAAGVAYLGSFRWDSDTPCFVFAGQSWKTNFNFASTAISHEVGHTLGLAHDGRNGSEYYGGHGSGSTSWGPIMGNPSTALTQWSNGDYSGATNRQDDLVVMTTG